MTLDSNELAVRRALAERFVAAVTKSFVFLESAGFSACPWSSQSPEEYRDAAFVTTYILSKRAIDVRLELATRQICVVVFDYDRVATCNERHKPRRVLDLDEWTEQNGLVTPAPLTWMKKNTLYEEVQRSLKYYFKQVERDLDTTVNFMAERLKHSGLHVRES